MATEAKVILQQMVSYEAPDGRKRLHLEVRLEKKSGFLYLGQVFVPVPCCCVEVMLMTQCLQILVQTQQMTCIIRQVVLPCLLASSQTLVVAASSGKVFQCVAQSPAYLHLDCLPPFEMIIRSPSLSLILPCTRTSKKYGLWSPSIMTSREGQVSGRLPYATQGGSLLPHKLVTTVTEPL